MKRVVAVGVFGALVVGLAGCAPVSGGPLHAATPQVALACVDIPDYSVPMLAAEVRNAGGTAAAITAVTVGRVNNLTVNTFRVGAHVSLPAVSFDNGLIFTSRYRDPAVKPVVVPAGVTYDVVALASLDDDITPGSLSSFQVSYTVAGHAYVMDTTQAYELSSQLGCQNG